MGLRKPQTLEELPPPFHVIGEPDWESRLRSWLTDFDIEFPTPCLLSELMAVESRLGFRLPEDWRVFLLAFGPLDLGDVRLSSPDRIAPMDGVWFRSHLTATQQSMLPQMLRVGECGSGDFIALQTTDGWVCECRHDPGGLWNWCPSFSDFLRLQLIRMWSGFYGWPDESVAELSDELANRWLNEWNQQRPATESED